MRDNGKEEEQNKNNNKRRGTFCDKRNFSIKSAQKILCTFCCDGKADRYVHIDM